MADTNNNLIVQEIDNESIPTMSQDKEELLSYLKKTIDSSKITIELDRKCMWIIDQILQKCATLNIDWFTAIIGGEGIGKTTLALNCFALVCERLVLDALTALVRTLIYDEDELLEFLTTINPNEKFYPIFLDEGANILFNRDSMQKHRSYILKFFNVMRFLNCFVFITSPNIKFLDKNVRTHRIKSIFYIPERGVYWYYDKPQIDRMVAIETSKHWYWIEPKIVGTYGVNSELEKITNEVKKQYVQRFSNKVSTFLTKKDYTNSKDVL